MECKDLDAATTQSTYLLNTKRKEINNKKLIIGCKYKGKWTGSLRVVGFYFYQHGEWKDPIVLLVI